MKCAIILVGFQSFDEGTISLILTKPKIVLLTYAIYTAQIKHFGVAYDFYYKFHFTI